MFPPDSEDPLFAGLESFWTPPPSGVAHDSVMTGTPPPPPPALTDTSHSSTAQDAKGICSQCCVGGIHCGGWTPGKRPQPNSPSLSGIATFAASCVRVSMGLLAQSFSGITLQNGVTATDCPDATCADICACTYAWAIADGDIPLCGAYVHDFQFGCPWSNTVDDDGNPLPPTLAPRCPHALRPLGCFGATLYMARADRLKVEINCPCDGFPPDAICTYYVQQDDCTLAYGGTWGGTGAPPCPDGTFWDGGCICCLDTCTSDCTTCHSTPGDCMAPGNGLGDETCFASSGTSSTDDPSCDGYCDGQSLKGRIYGFALLGCPDGLDPAAKPWIKGCNPAGLVGQGLTPTAANAATWIPDDDFGDFYLCMLGGCVATSCDDDSACATCPPCADSSTCGDGGFDGDGRALCLDSTICDCGGGRCNDGSLCTCADGEPCNYYYDTLEIFCTPSEMEMANHRAWLLLANGVPLDEALAVTGARQATPFKPCRCSDHNPRCPGCHKHRRNPAYVEAIDLLITAGGGRVLGASPATPAAPPAPEEGPGTEFKKLTDQLGLKEWEGCSCERIRSWMNSLGVEGCRTNRAKLIKAIRANFAAGVKSGKLPKEVWKVAAANALKTGLAFKIGVTNWLDPLPALVDLAIHNAAARAASETKPS